MASQICYYCHSTDGQNLGRISDELIAFFRTKYPNFSRTNQLCDICRDRAVRKMKHVKRKTQSLKRKADSQSIEEKTRSYSNPSSSSVLSDASNHQSPKRKRTVAKRTGGRPLHPIGSDENDQPQQQQPAVVIDLFRIPSSEQTSRSESSRISSRSRSQSLTRPPTPERMLSMSSEERSQEHSTYQRGLGG